MSILGIGYREQASEASLFEAIEALPVSILDITAIATLEGKRGTPQIAHLAQNLQMPVFYITRTELAAQTTKTQSEQIQALFGTGSLCEAAALAAAGPGATLLASRSISKDRMATAAIAKGPNS
ncbi:MAG: cobalamin biosynthesis protein [Cohaesibacter sp.]|jgi:cobalt-precorrin 5A hydrolase|nr:cobalamin biosynthesis protein [Cohaesibacter sp.]